MRSMVYEVFKRKSAEEKEEIRFKVENGGDLGDLVYIGISKLDLLSKLGY